MNSARMEEKMEGINWRSGNKKRNIRNLVPNNQTMQKLQPSNILHTRQISYTNYKFFHSHGIY